MLILAIFFGVRHRRRRSNGQTASTTETSTENEKQREKCDEVNEPPPPCPYSTHAVAYPAATFQGAQKDSDTVPYQTNALTNLSIPQRSFDGSQAYPVQSNYSDITTHAPRPQAHRTGSSIVRGLDPNSSGLPCMSCAQHHRPDTSRSGTMVSLGLPQEEHDIYDSRQCVAPSSPPLPPGAMPPLPSPTLETYENQFMSLSPPESPKSPGGSSMRRWIMSPLSRSGTTRTALPPYEQPGEGVQGRVSEKKEKEKEKDESALAASVYAFITRGCVRIVEMSFGGPRKGCFKCGNLGHIAEACPSEMRLCYNCRQPGHESVNCPSPRSTQAKQCYMCGGVGHIQVDCPNNLRPSGGSGGSAASQKCYNCGRPGHIARVCPSAAGGLGGHSAAGGGFRGGFGRGGGAANGTVKCFRCQGPNHYARDCMAAPGTTALDSKPKTCYKCHKEGHIARECPEGAEYAT
ncbi:Zinc finger protein GIS2 OS=Saccharomyces cerevisiae (strain ATCC 204508 / S288c) GN=GIS2 PE=1 SV=1 [Rhizoctonia solani AG-1 IB]|uniref:Zinc finger protein GIS2 n=1 Tax=Thanatephorus cucumeris (strain AG1-IB / isolate 7/3/14) TaxID=1108050 RepID=A0A0B7G3S8_THACB|nr:Zinc finger protein GIS2 OS=Saccharomyces cerevisiae (strain ATCC 204508 / S288c) GN=GIS2 PE=1 SV=1 [Rhizoctonia solani AG-1 IB]